MGSERLADIEAHLDPLLKHKDIDNVSHEVSDLESAKLSVAIAYALDTLYYIYLRTNGTEIKSHPVRKELERVKKYIEKIKTVSNPTEVQKLKLDKNAARRFVRHSLADKTRKMKALDLSKSWQCRGCSAPNEAKRMSCSTCGCARKLVDEEDENKGRTRGLK